MDTLAFEQPIEELEAKIQQLVDQKADDPDARKKSANSEKN